MLTFEDSLAAAIRASAGTPRPLAPGECQSARLQRCPLCNAATLDYTSEVHIKNEALRKFWNTVRAGIPLDPLVVSPRGREYRTVTKRRVFLSGKSIRLGLIHPVEEIGIRPFEVLWCAIEPREHAAIYRTALDAMQNPRLLPLAEQLSYVVIKGTYTEFAVVFNVRDASATVRRAANSLSKTLTNSCKGISGVFLYQDESSPGYYMGSRGAGVHPRITRIFGKSEIQTNVLGRSFRFSPLSFSQVNLSLVESMITKARELLALKGQMMLFDLYSGYGLFALCLAQFAAGVNGLEISPASVTAALANARRQRVPNARFFRADVNVESIGRAMRRSAEADAVILDPPRSGTAQGVIECIAARRPAKVLHIFCNIDLIRRELKRWTDCGFKPVRVIPFDMFPGTSAVEMMVLLERR